MRHEFRVPQRLGFPDSHLTTTHHQTFEVGALSSAATLRKLLAKLGTKSHLFGEQHLSTLIV